MSYQILIDERVSDETAEIFNYYDAINPGLAYDFYEQLDIVYNQLEKNPSIWQIVEGDIRRALLKRFPYAVYYRVLEGQRILVMTIRHNAQNPESRFD
ncbi:MAG: type II toxin-antitoxin system RelE/ParE family toxin [Bacteroidia bacterium]|nr:type II toxin-antitoxin system RelE/ParE family toxin [Bacteroidia bacterium]